MAAPVIQRSIESYGVGQSGYCAGRVGDHALEQQLEDHNVCFRTDEEERTAADRGDDDRFTGRGGTHSRA